MYSGFQDHVAVQYLPREQHIIQPQEPILLVILIVVPVVLGSSFNVASTPPINTVSITPNKS
jgi:hypothetical protein